MQCHQCFARRWTVHLPKTARSFRSRLQFRLQVLTAVEERDWEASSSESLQEKFAELACLYDLIFLREMMLKVSIALAQLLSFPG